MQFLNISHTGEFFNHAIVRFSCSENCTRQISGLVLMFLLMLMFMSREFSLVLVLVLVFVLVLVLMLVLMR